RSAPTRARRGVVLSAVRDVLAQRRLRRIAVLSGALVLLVGTVAALGAGWVRRPGRPRAEGAPPVTTAPTQPAPRPAPRIEQPQVLVAELAGARHAYVTGMSDRPASAPDSAARDEDERVRDAYDGISVRAGGPVVHSAEVVRQPGSEDTAVLHAITSLEQLRLDESARSTASGPRRLPWRCGSCWGGTASNGRSPMSRSSRRTTRRRRSPDAEGPDTGGRCRGLASASLSGSPGHRPSSPSCAPASSRFFMKVRKRAASPPSTMRWS